MATDERFVKVLKETVNWQDQEILRLNTRIKTLENLVHELQTRNAFIDDITADIPMGDFKAVTEEKVK